MTRLSIVVACFDRTDLLEETLISVLQNRPRSSEVVVVHDGRYQDPYDLKDEVCFISVSPGTGWVGSIEAGLAEAQGEIVHILGAGVLPQADWTESALGYFDDPAIGSVCPLLIDGSQASNQSAESSVEHPLRIRCVGVQLNWSLSRKLVGSGQAFRRDKANRLKPLGPNLVAAFYRREALENCGGINDEFGDELADVDVARRLDEAGYETVVDLDSKLQVNDFDRPRRSFAAQGRHHQQFIESCTELASWRRRLATWSQVAMDVVTSPLDPRRLSTVWGRMSVKKAVIEAPASSEEPEILPLRAKVSAAEESHESQTQQRRAA